MKLIRTADQKIGLFVRLPKGPHVIDIIGSLGVFEHDPLSNGLLNGALKGGCDWFLIVEHWAYLRSPLKKLMSIAKANPEHPRLVLQPIKDSLETRDIIAIEITDDAVHPIIAIGTTEMETLEECDPACRPAMERRFDLPPDSALPKDTTVVTEVAQVIDFSSFQRRGGPRR
jgi:hypothetical protein